MPETGLRGKALRNNISIINLAQSSMLHEKNHQNANGESNDPDAVGSLGFSERGSLLRYTGAAEGAAHTGSNEGQSGETRARWLTKGPHPLADCLWLRLSRDRGRERTHC